MKLYHRQSNGLFRRLSASPSPAQEAFKIFRMVLEIFDDIEEAVNLIVPRLPEEDPSDIFTHGNEVERHKAIFANQVFRFINLCWYEGAPYNLYAELLSLSTPDSPNARDFSSLRKRLTYEFGEYNNNAIGSRAMGIVKAAVDFANLSWGVDIGTFLGHPVDRAEAMPPTVMRRIHSRFSELVFNFCWSLNDLRSRINYILTAYPEPELEDDPLNLEDLDL